MKKYCIFILVVFNSISIVQAQDYEGFMKQAAIQEQQMKENEALNTYKQALIVKPDAIAPLLKCSTLSLYIACRESNKDVIIKLLDEAKTYVYQILKIDINNYEAYYLMAGISGKYTEVEDEKKKIVSYVKDIKTFADKAIQINPSYGKAWHVLGKWHYEVSNLSGLKKTAIKLFYGGMPDASLEEAIKCYEKCLTLDPSYILNYVELAKAYRDNNESIKESNILQRTLKLPARTLADLDLKIRAKTRLEELQ